MDEATILKEIAENVGYDLLGLPLHKRLRRIGGIDFEAEMTAKLSKEIQIQIDKDIIDMLMGKYKSV